MSNTNSNEHDDMLFHMLKECKTLPIFLDHIFGFLQRRTDFYCTATCPNSAVGLPTGLAEQLVKHTYLKWTPASQNESVILQETEIPAAVIEEEVVAEDICEEVTSDMENMNIEENSHEKESEQNMQPKIVPPSNNDFSIAESYNGTVHNTYCWSQTITEVDITIKVPENTTSKRLQVSIAVQKISVKVNNSVILEGELCHKCKHNEAVWSLDKNQLQIHLDKCAEAWWDCLVTSEDRLDLTKLDCSRPFEELPEDAQAKIQELSWNQERKRLGLPTSDELTKQEILRKAWNAEGSPFSGPFDPSQVAFH